MMKCPVCDCELVLAETLTGAENPNRKKCPNGHYAIAQEKSAKIYRVGNEVFEITGISKRIAGLDLTKAIKAEQKRWLQSQFERDIYSPWEQQWFEGDREES